MTPALDAMVAAMAADLRSQADPRWGAPVHGHSYFERLGIHGVFDLYAVARAALSALEVLPAESTRTIGRERAEVFSQVAAEIAKGEG